MTEIRAPNTVLTDGQTCKWSTVLAASGDQAQRPWTECEQNFMAEQQHGHHHYWYAQVQQEHGVGGVQRNEFEGKHPTDDEQGFMGRIDEKAGLAQSEQQLFESLVRQDPPGCVQTCEHADDQAGAVEVDVEPGGVPDGVNQKNWDQGDAGQRAIAVKGKDALSLDATERTG